MATGVDDVDGGDGDDEGDGGSGVEVQNTEQAYDVDNTDMFESAVENEVSPVLRIDTQSNSAVHDNYNSDSDSATDSIILIKDDNDEAESSSTTISDNSQHFRKTVTAKNLNGKITKRQCTTSTSDIPSKRSCDEIQSVKEEDDQICPICLETWTSEGIHRLSSLKCGHLFGKSCISNWLVKQKKNCCPQCNKKASSYDIRELFATRLIALDYSEKTKLEKEITTIKEEKHQVEVELAKCQLRAESYKMEIQKLQNELSKYTGKTEINSCDLMYKFHLEKTLPIADGNCRVCAYDPINKMLVVCHQRKNQLYKSGFGVKKIFKLGTDYISNNYLHLHLKTIRDIRFHPLKPNIILTVAFDKSAKVCDLEKQSVVHTFSSDYVLWSCCWDEEEPNYFYVGNGKGTVYGYDVRSPDFPVVELQLEGDTSSVVSICYVPSKAPHDVHGGIICCRLNSVVYYEKNGPREFNTHRFTSLVGPFFSVIFDPHSRHFVVSSRPSAAVPNVRHIYCALSEKKCQPVHMFVGGTIQSVSNYGVRHQVQRYPVFR
ncbi:hypothetical protein RUM44_009608 [Polyplax serrata]|uniref:RING-type E3 ubiquitin transferase n=1 Tax=Polyplax serrata TaxID=468196 RepID=A0ABR1AT99_POLSC